MEQNFLKIKNFYPSKDTKTIKRQPKWEKTFANHISDKGLRSRTHTELLKMTKNKNSIKKWARDLNRHFSKKDMQNGQQAYEKSSVSSTTMMRYHLTPIRVGTVRDNGKNKYWWDAENWNAFPLRVEM